MKNKLLLSVLVLLAIAIPVYAVATSIGYIGASWNHDPVTVYVSMGKGVDPSYASEVQTALNDWSSALQTATGSSNFAFEILTTPPGKRNPADISINLKKNTGAVLGSTSLSSYGGNLSITKITIATQNAMGKPLDKADFRNILRHELGHALGLGHANDDGTGDKDLMYPYYDFITVGYDVFPSILDNKALVKIYGNDGFGGNNMHPIPSQYP